MARENEETRSRKASIATLFGPLPADVTPLEQRIHVEIDAA